LLWWRKVKMPSHLYGPVLSRRLGLSLGVDITPLKTCSYDCLYCQLGKTTRKSIQREHFYPPGEILQQIRKALREGPGPDVVTFSGSGEPTLNADLGDLIRGVKAFTDVPVAVITNSSLIYEPKVQEELLATDLVVPSFDAASEEIFHKINRPYPDLKLEKIREGLIRFRSRYGGKIRLEILFLDGINNSAEELEYLRQAVREMNPDGIDLNTVIRPPAEESAKPLSYEQLEKIRDFFGKGARIVFRLPLFRRQASSHRTSRAILEMVGRRPCSLEELAAALGRHHHEVSKYLGALVEGGEVKERRHAGGTFFVAKEEST
jgi:wyosine [tRNA(Phe)-imidazoG37] synthetase (radical SAM superfamily)